MFFVCEKVFLNLKRKYLFYTDNFLLIIKFFYYVI